jgi:hypothetical protein
MQRSWTRVLRSTGFELCLRLQLQRAGWGVTAWERRRRGGGARVGRALMSTSRWKIRVGSRTVASAPG